METILTYWRHCSDALWILFAVSCSGKILFIILLKNFVQGHCWMSTPIQSPAKLDTLQTPIGNKFANDYGLTKHFSRLAKISAIRGSSIWLHAKFIWRYSSLHQEVTNLRREMMDFIRQV
jgi:hypothetical protein